MRQGSARAAPAARGGPLTGRVGRPVGLLLAALLAGCAGPAADPVALDQARAALERARSAPRVRALAPAELDRAEVALAAAEAAVQAGAPATRVDHLSYLASQHAALAEVQALDRVAKDEIAVLERALGPSLVAAALDQNDPDRIAREPAPGRAAREPEPGRAAGAPPPTLPAGATSTELTLNLAELRFDPTGPSYAAAKELEQSAARLLREPNLTVAIRADFDQPELAARPTMERRVEMVRAELLRRGVEASRIRVRADASP